MQRVAGEMAVVRPKSLKERSRGKKQEDRRGTEENADE